MVPKFSLAYNTRPTRVFANFSDWTLVLSILRIPSSDLGSEIWEGPLQGRHITSDLTRHSRFQIASPPTSKGTDDVLGAVDETTID